MQSPTRSAPLFCSSPTQSPCHPTTLPPSHPATPPPRPPSLSRQWRPSRSWAGWGTLRRGACWCTTPLPVSDGWRQGGRVVGTSALLVHHIIPVQGSGLEGGWNGVAKGFWRLLGDALNHCTPPTPFSPSPPPPLPPTPCPPARSPLYLHQAEGQAARVHRVWRRPPPHPADPAPLRLRQVHGAGALGRATRAPGAHPRH